MMFKPTQSIISRGEGRNQASSPYSSKNKHTNLLRLLQNTDLNDNQEQQTFEEFMDVVNKFDFQKNQQLQTRTGNLMKPKISLHETISFDHRGLNRNGKGLFGPKTESLDINIGGSNNEFQGMPQGNFLGIVREQLISRASTKRNVIQNLNKGLDLAVSANQMFKNRQDLGKGDVGESGSMYKSSAHSSRSFNGFEQINQYEIKEKLGSGGFSTVHLCIDVHTQKKYAMKVVNKKGMRKKIFRKNSMALVDNFINNQIAIVKKIEHPYIIKLYEVIEDEVKNKIYMIFEYCEGGYINEVKNKDLFSSNGSRYRKLLESECKRYYKQLTLAIDYIHNVAKIAHRDIKPENILLSGKDEVKVSDFGLGTQDLQVSSRSGTLGYLPPQVRHKNLLSTSNPKHIAQMADIWALGMTLLVLLQGKNVQIEDNQLETYIENMRDISIECKDVLKCCLKLDPEQRISASRLLDHPWVQAKKTQTYQEIQISKEDQQQAIIKVNNEILTEIVRMNMI